MAGMGFKAAIQFRKLLARVVRMVHALVQETWLFSPLGHIAAIIVASHGHSSLRMLMALPIAFAFGNEIRDGLPPRMASSLLEQKLCWFQPPKSCTFGVASGVLVQVPQALIVPLNCLALPILCSMVSHQNHSIVR
ncbi:hypothetical protein B0H63DRAFT_34852 [Podospora didyma]|uniref:Uncharacterized protein n=1 Tax=Podospora didyma TaxID=330526 RepID=A0AAE0P684_9PEZI|nr:hypothetical protein B0H63DRAFT_34852 [Podospora didyma]